MRALRFAESPLVTAAMGAMCIATSAVLVRLSDTTPVTVAVYRCAYAIPFLAAITLIERKRFGGLPRRATRLAWVAGVFFALDLIFWHNAIDAVGAGLATVLGNLQVLLVAFIAWAVLGERPTAGLFAAIPIVLVGVVLISGVVGEGAYGEDPVLGVVLGAATSLAYAGFLLVLRQGSGDLRRIAGPLFHATWVAGVVSAVYGVLRDEMVWDPGLESHGWLFLLALASQVAGWLFISRSLPRLPAAVTSVILLLQPVGAMALAGVTLGESPSLAQGAGAALILVGVVVATSSQRGRGATEPDPLVEAGARAAP